MGKGAISPPPQPVLKMVSNELSIHTYMLLMNFHTNFFLYFPKIPSEMNSTHPFYPILIPNTPYVKFVG